MAVNNNQMSKLSQETIDRIKADSKKYSTGLKFPKDWSETRIEADREEAETDYQAGATEWAGRAQPLLDALEEIDKRIDGFKSGASYKIEMIKPLVKAAIAKYKEVSNG